MSYLDSPVKYYPLRPDLSVALTPSAKGAKDAVYKFKRESDGTSYIGSTAHVGRRVNGHVYSFRHEDKEAGQSAVAQAVRTNYKDIFFGVLASNVEDVALEEDRYVQANKQKGPLFNKRRGGGGGAKRPTKQKTVSENVDIVYNSPKKSYPLNPDTLKVELTPSAKGDIYVFKRTDGDEVTRYVGETERAVQRRLGEHSHYARHPEKPRGKRRLYTDMRENPEQIEVKVMSSKELGGKTASDAEKGLIRYFKDLGAELYNANGGGGGGSARRTK